MCGELAGDTAMTEALVGLGLHELSMSAGTIPEVKQKVRQTDSEKAKKLAAGLLNQKDGDQVRRFIQEQKS
ncbi:Phosphoenolpyruvate-protein phosphotransferase [compost metagenome]